MNYGQRKAEKKQKKIVSPNNSSFKNELKETIVAHNIESEKEQKIYKHKEQYWLNIFDIFATEAYTFDLKKRYELIKKAFKKEIQNGTNKPNGKGKITCYVHIPVEKHYFPGYIKLSDRKELENIEEKFYLDPYTIENIIKNNQAHFKNYVSYEYKSEGMYRTFTYENYKLKLMLEEKPLIEKNTLWKRSGWGVFRNIGEKQESCTYLLSEHGKRILDDLKKMTESDGIIIREKIKSPIGNYDKNTNQIFAPYISLGSPVIFPWSCWDHDSIPDLYLECEIEL